MSMPDRRRIGFDRTIAAEWLDAAVARVMTGEATGGDEEISLGFS